MKVDEQYILLALFEFLTGMFTFVYFTGFESLAYTNFGLALILFLNSTNYTGYKIQSKEIHPKVKRRRINGILISGSYKK